MSTGFQREVLMERRTVAYMTAGLVFGLAAVLSGNHLLLGIPLFILGIIAANYLYISRAARGIDFLMSRRSCACSRETRGRLCSPLPMRGGSRY